MALRSINIKLNAITSDFAKSMKGVERNLSRFARQAETAGKSLTMAFTLPLGGAAVAAVRTFAQFDKLQKGLEAVTGSAAEGARQMDSLLNVVKDTKTTLDLRAAARVSLQLQGVGVAAENAERLIRQLGIAATATGATADDVGEVGRQLSQSLAMGAVKQEELNVLLERLPALGRVIREEFGVVTAEGIRNAGISAQEFVQRLTEAAEADTKLQAVKGGLSKSIETFGINLQIAGKVMGESIAKALNLEVNLAKLADVLFRASNAFKSMNPGAQKAILIIGGITIVMGPLTVALGAMARVLPLLATGFRVLRSAMLLATGPVGLIVAGLVALAGAINWARNRFDGFKTATDKIAATMIELAKIIVTGPGRAIGLVVEGFQKAFAGDFGGASRALLQATGLFDSPEYTSAGERLGRAWREGFGRGAGGVGSSAYPVMPDFANPLAAGRRRGLPALGAAAAAAPTWGDGGAAATAGGGTSRRRRTTAGVESGAARFQGAFTEALQTSLSESLAKLQADGALGAMAELNMKPLASAINPLTALGAQFEIIDAKAMVFGKTFDGVTEKINATKAAITAALEEGFSPTSNTITAMTEQLAIFQEQVAKTPGIFGGITEIFNQLGAQFVAMIDSQTLSLKKFGVAALETIRKVIGALIKEGVVAAVSKALQNPAIAINPLLIPGIAAGAGALAQGAFSAVLNSVKTPKLAKGGLAFGPTMAVVGDNPGARANPEVIAPLSALTGMLEGALGGGGGQLTARISGEDLLILLDRASVRRNRVR